MAKGSRQLPLPLGDDFAELGQDPPTSEVPAPAHLTRTSRELLGQRPLPNMLRERPVLYVLGPRGVGKSTVARRLCGEERVELGCDQLRKALIGAARRGGFTTEVVEAPALLLDDVECLYNRFGAVALVGRLVNERAAAGRRTVLCEGSDSSIQCLYDPVPYLRRASVLLRFPVGKGRRNHVRQRCLDRGVDPTQAAQLVTLEPWSYAAVEDALDRLVARAR